MPAGLLAARPRPRLHVRLYAIAALLLATAAGLVGCGSDEPSADPSSPESTAAGTEPTSAPTATTAGPPPMTPAATGLVVARCEEDSYALSTVDPATGTEAPLVEFTLVGEPSYGCTRLRDYPSIVLQTTFDPSFSRLAVSLAGEPDGSQRVGWQHADGSVVDVTAALAEVEGTLPEEASHESPVFGPDGAIWFLDATTNEVVTVPVNDDGSLGAPTRAPYDGGRRFVVTPWGEIWPEFSSDPGPSVCLSNAGPGGLFVASDKGISPQLWLNAQEVLQLEQDGAVMAIAPAIEWPGGPGFCPSPGLDMELGAMGVAGEMRSPVAEGDASHIAFLVSAGGALQVTTFDFASPPALVGTLSNPESATFLVDWRA